MSGKWLFYPRRFFEREYSIGTGLVLYNADKSYNWTCSFVRFKDYVD